jgi:nucleoside 2-deoxyribosyltransferase
MIIYLAAPIDFDDTSEISKIKHEIKKHFKEKNCTWVYDPASAWLPSSDLQPDEYVHWANLKVLTDADLVVAVLKKGVLTVGTILELQHAHDLGTRSIVIGDLGGNSVGLAALGIPVYASIKEWSEDDSFTF